jgi:hypothetical protein
MKKTIFFLLLITGVIFLYSCSNEETEKAKTADSVANHLVADTSVNHLTATDTSVIAPLEFDGMKFTHGPCLDAGHGNLIIKPGDAATLIGNFENTYHKPGSNQFRRLKSFYWIDACTVKAIHAFFEARKEYDGLWITLGANADKDFESTVFFVPTKWNTASEEHLPDWAAVKNIILTGCNTKQFFSDKPSDFITKYREFYRLEKNPPVRDELSRKVWIHKCVFDELTDIINSPPPNPNPVSGVSFICAAYHFAIGAAFKPKGLADNSQTTFIIAVTRNVQGKQVPDWSINKSLYKNFTPYLRKKNKLKDDDPDPVFNHGELCPNSCGVDDE